MTTKKCLFIDVDSTLVPFEGVDELARKLGPDTFKLIEDLTNQAMDGTIPLGAVYCKRLEIIKPTKKEVYEDLAKMYVDGVLPGAAEAISALLKDGWKIALISGGCQQAIEPMAERLGVKTVVAVPWNFDDATGAYTGIVQDAPTASNGGKPVAVKRLMDEWVTTGRMSLSSSAKEEKQQEQEDCDRVFSCMIGDGMSDLEAKTSQAVNSFIAFTGVVSRPSIVPKSDCATTTWTDIPGLLNECLKKSTSA